MARIRSLSLWGLMVIASILTLNSVQCQTTNSTCHYSCAASACTSPMYYDCLTCRQNRGIQSLPSVPFAGMCYCVASMDETPNGQCQPSSTFSYSSRSLVWAFIILSLVLSAFMLVVRGFRYYFIKTIQDIQELSLIIFVNMYFPQQFDQFLAQLYRFNISSFLFQSMTNGGLFEVGPDGSVVSLDGMNVSGKYNLLFKTANFFSNMFTWTIVLLILIVVAIIIRIINNKLVSKQKLVQKVSQEKVANLMDASQSSLGNPQNNQSFVISENISEIMNQSPERQEIIREKYKVTNLNRSDPYSLTLTNLTIKLNNILSYNFFIIFLYLSLIEININIFTQLNNLKFVSSFAGLSSILAIVFLILQIILLIYLFIKCYRQLDKPQWMHDHSYSALLYLIRTNYKIPAKYFFFYQALKKILFALIIAMCYENPSDAILGFCILQMIFVCTSMYFEPFEKRYIRLHFYICECFKLFLFVGLINFVQKYNEYTALTQVTSIFFFMFAAIFGLHFVLMLIGLLIQRKVYWYATKRVYNKIKRSCSKSDSRQSSSSELMKPQEEIVVGYFHYIREKEDKQQQQKSEHSDRYNMDKDMKQLQLSKEIKMSESQQGKQQQQEDKKLQPKWKYYFYKYKDYEKK